MKSLSRTEFFHACVICLVVTIVAASIGLGVRHAFADDGPPKEVLNAVEVINEETPLVWKLDEAIRPLKQERHEREARIVAAYELIASNCWSYDFAGPGTLSKADCPKDQPR
jgi:hypothetical protein